MENHIPCCRVVLCGDSVFMLAIEAALAPKAGNANSPGLELTRLPKQPGAFAHLKALAPDLIIYEKAGDTDILFRALAQEGIPLIEVNPAAQTAKMFTGRQMPLNDIRDLFHFLPSPPNQPAADFQPTSRRLTTKGTKS